MSILTYLNGWGIFLVALFGLFGNVLNMVVMSHRDMRSSPVCILIIGLAISDSFTLIIMNLQRMTGLMYLLDIDRPLENTVNIIMDGVTGFVLTNAVYFIVAITMERYMIIVHPLQAHAFNTWKQKRYLVMAVLCLSIVVNGFNATWRIILLEELIYSQDTLPGWLQQIDFLTTTIFVCVIPFLILLPMNIIISIQFRKFKRLGAELRQRRADDKDSVTPMLIAAVTCFTICFTPQFIFGILAIYKNFIHGDEAVYSFHLFLNQLGQLAAFMLVLQCSVNFLIYCGAGTKFRKTLKKILACA